MFKRIVADGRAVGLVLFAAVAIQGCEPAPTSERPRTGDADSNQPAANPNNEVTLTILDYAGLQQLIASKRSKVVLLDAWSTGCPPCLKSFPDLVALQRKIGP